MEKMKMLGVVTLFNSEKESALSNIACYAPYLDRLIVWDNSADSHADWFSEPYIDYQWTGRNTCIAPAINYAWHQAQQMGFQSLLLMDDDSQWTDFPAYRRDVEQHLSEGRVMVFTPYIKGIDTFATSEQEHEKRLFINSGTVIPLEILNAIGGVDEQAFPLDALDHDIAFSIAEHGYKAMCLCSHQLRHSLGYPQRMGAFRLFTPNYNRFRTYHMTRSHIICYRKHKALMTKEDRDYLFQEIIRRKFQRIILAEPDKFRRMAALIKGIISGYTYKI